MLFEDYITGYLTAFTILTALKRRAIEGGGYYIRLSLCQTALWLSGLGLVHGFTEENTKTLKKYLRADTEVSQHVETVATAFGSIEHLKPTLFLEKTPLKYLREVVPLGHDLPIWD